MKREFLVRTQEFLRYFINFKVLVNGTKAPR